MNSLSKILKQQTMYNENNENIFPIDRNIKVNVSKIDYSGTSTLVSSTVFQGNAVEITKNDTGSDCNYCIVDVTNTNYILDKSGKLVFASSTQASQQLEVRYNNNQTIEFTRLFKSDGTLAVININLYPRFYVISNQYNHS